MRLFSIQSLIKKIEICLILKKLVICVCVCLLINQIIALFYDYYCYPTVIQVQIRKPSHIKYPGLTVCAKRISNSNNNSELEKLDLSSTVRCHLRNDINCSGTPCEQISEPVMTAIDGKSCITFFSRLKANMTDKSNHMIKLKYKDRDNIFYSHITISKNKQFIENNKLYLILHSSNQLTDANLHQYAIKESPLSQGMVYSLIFSKYTVERLPAPYHTDCFDYETNNFKIKDVFGMSTVDCIEKCKKKVFQKWFECIPRDLNLIDSENATLCATDELLETSIEANQVKEEMNLCDINCPLDCTKETFSYELLNGEPINNTENPYLSGESLRVYVAVKITEEFTYILTPKWVTSEFFGSIGGIFSLWIGASVLNLIQMMSNFYCYLKQTKLLKRFNVNSKLFSKTNIKRRMNSRNIKFGQQFSGGRNNSMLSFKSIYIKTVN